MIFALIYAPFQSVNNFLRKNTMQYFLGDILEFSTCAVTLDDI